MPPRRRRRAAAGTPASGARAAAPDEAAPAQTMIEDLPDTLLSTIFTMAGPLALVG